LIEVGISRFWSSICDVAALCFTAATRSQFLEAATIQNCAGKKDRQTPFDVGGEPDDRQLGQVRQCNFVNGRGAILRDTVSVNLFGATR
jgi:hypothetical protein